MSGERGNPAELPAELDNGGGGILHRPGHPGELPPFSSFNLEALVAELVALVSRVGALETAQVALRLGARRPVLNPGIHELPRASEFLFRNPGPQELPAEFGDGGGGGGGFRPPRINELPPFELTEMVREMAGLRAALTQVSAQVQGLTEKLATRG